AGNAILTDLLQVSRTLLRVYNDRAVHAEEDMQTALEEHAEILSALEEGDGDRAASAMIVHMASARDRILRVADALDAERSEEHTSELQSRFDLVCRLLLEKKKKYKKSATKKK